MSMEAKWKTNQDKAAFLKTFPGLLTSWEQSVGQTIQQVTPLSSEQVSAVVIFSNSTFGVVPPLSREPRDLKIGLSAARAVLEPQHREAFAEYDRLSSLDQEAGRKARMDNILGAIKNNLDDIPELKDHIRSLVKTWDKEPV